MSSCDDAEALLPAVDIYSKPLDPLRQLNGESGALHKPLQKQSQWQQQLTHSLFQVLPLEIQQAAAILSKPLSCAEVTLM